MMCYRECIRLCPSYAMAYNNMALACIQTKDYATAKQLLAHAIELDPNLMSARSNAVKLEALTSTLAPLRAPSINIGSHPALPAVAPLPPLPAVARPLPLGLPPLAPVAAATH